MEFLKIYWLQIKQQIEQRTSREKWFILITFLAIFYFIIDRYMFQPLINSNNNYLISISEKKQTIESLQQELGGLSKTIEKNNLRTMDQRITLLEKDIQRLKTEVNSLANQLISPDEMARLLSNILTKTSRINIIKVENLTETNLFEKNPNDKNEVHIYKHGLELEFSANFFNTFAFLKTIEKLPWRVVWDSFSYKVDKYPDAVSKLVIYTLSLEKGWISG